MGNILAYICSDTEFLQILKQIKLIEDQFYNINKNSVVSVKLEEKFEKLINKLKNPNSSDTNEIIAEAKEILKKLRKIQNDGVDLLEEKIKQLYIYIGDFITNKDIRDKQKKIKFLKELELKLLNECTILMEEYKKNADFNTKDPFISKINSELIDFKEYMRDMKNIKSKSYYSEIENSIKNIDEKNISNSINIEDQSSSILKSIEKNLDTSSLKKKSGYKPIQRIKKTLQSKLSNQEEQITQENNQEFITNNNQETIENQITQQVTRKRTQESIKKNNQEEQVSQENTNLYKSVFNNLKDSKKLIQNNDDNEKTTTDIIKYMKPLNEKKQKKSINQKTITDIMNIIKPKKVSINNNHSIQKENNKSNIEILQTKYKGEGKHGDFKWEIQEKIEPRTLYLYLDRDEDTFKRDKSIKKFDKDGIYPRSIHISIQEEDKLTIPLKNKIHKEIEKIKEIIKEGKYNKIKYNFKDIDIPIKEFIELKLKKI